MPVVYVAVGRRLGFPLYLVETRGHLFFRWDDSQGTILEWQNPDVKLWIPPDRFNVEGAGEGIAYYSDAYYLQSPEAWQQIDFDHGRFLRSMSPKEELAAFLIQRAECFYDLHNLGEALKAIYYARQLCPDDKRYQWLHAKRSKEWSDRQAALAHIEEMQQDRIRRQKMLEGLASHPVYCPCGQCQQARRGGEMRASPPHGASCQCLHCREAREVAESPQGIPGHSRHCLCLDCTQRRSLTQRVLQRQSFSPGGPGQFPQQRSGANLPHPPKSGLPHPRGMPGF